MDLALGGEYEAFRAEVRAFLEAAGEEISGPQASRAAIISWQKTLIAEGYAGRTTPGESGGFGAAPDILKSRIIAEEFSRARAPGQFPAGQGVSMLVPTSFLEAGQRGASKTGLDRSHPHRRSDLVPGL